MRYLFLLIFLSSCSVIVGKNEPKSAKGSLYSIRFSRAGWVYTKDNRSDYVFENADGRIILSNSFCDDFQDQPLEQLATKTFNAVSLFKPQVSEYTTFQNREAYRLEGTGSVDGVRVNLRLLNTRRNNCYFDFFAITPTTAPQNDQSFEDFLKSVVFQ